MISSPAGAPAAGPPPAAPLTGPPPVPAQRQVLEANQRWLEALRGGDGPGGGLRRDEALRQLHDLLLRAARFEAGRRRSALVFVSPSELNDLTMQAADDALVGVLAKLGQFRGDSRFTTWAYKFAIYETSVKLRRRSWQDREVQLEGESWSLIADGGGGPQAEAEHTELLTALREGITTVLTPHQRNVLVTLALNGVPVDVLAERLGTTRGALYKTLHDARRKLRAHLAACGLEPSSSSGKDAS